MYLTRSTMSKSFSEPPSRTGWSLSSLSGVQVPQQHGLSSHLTPSIYLQKYHVTFSSPNTWGYISSFGAIAYTTTFAWNHWDTVGIMNTGTISLTLRNRHRLPVCLGLRPLHFFSLLCVLLPYPARVSGNVSSATREEGVEVYNWRQFLIHLF